MIRRTTPLAGRQEKFLRILASAFAQLGYRRATTAELARRCGVRENVLYRIWPSKKAMFLAAIDYVYDSSVSTWLRLLTRDGAAEGSAERLLAYESAHHGEFGLYRIVFAGLSEADDPEIRGALHRMYSRFHDFITQQISAQGRPAEPHRPDSALTAWGIIGLGTVSNIIRELQLASDAQRRDLFVHLGRFLLEGKNP